jgi:sulfur carrier protein
VTQTARAEITVNGEKRDSAPGGTVRSLVSELTNREVGADGRAVDGKTFGVAVARNGGVVPRSQWHNTALAAGDDIEIVSAVQGG